MFLRAVRYCPSVRCYALSGTVLAYGATRCLVLPDRMLLRAVRYFPSVCCYALSGTALAYAPTCCPLMS
eukprot:2731789-Rhodomonas_salina.1